VRSTGRLLLHDPASRGFEAPRRAVKPTSWLHRYGPVLNQGDVNGCTGWSAADWLNSAKALANRRRYNRTHLLADRAYLGDDDGLALYEAATRNDPFRWSYPPTDKGSSGLGVGKALKALGVIDSYLWTFSFDQLLAHGALQPVLLGTIWTEAMSDPNARGEITLGSAAQVRAAIDDGMGHEFTLRGVNWPRKQARIRNHWTAEWGLSGDALISLDDLELLIIKYKGDVMVPTLAAT
jgi:hypothetical protein